MANETRPTYEEVISTIRELVFDLNPVGCFTVAKQDFSVKTDDVSFLSQDLTPTIKAYLYENNTKYFNLIQSLKVNGFAISLSLTHVPKERTEFTSVLSDYVPTFNAEGLTPVEIFRENYFSLPMIEETILEHLVVFYPCTQGCYTRDSIETVFNDMCHLERLRMTLWVAYYLIEEQRKNIAAVNHLKMMNGEDVGTCDPVSKNMNQTITAKIGDTFSVTETEADTDGTFDGFTALWGDRDSYLAKYQLYLRTKYEILFKDHSLRDNVMITQSFGLIKNWLNSSYVNYLTISEFSEDILSPYNS